MSKSTEESSRLSASEFHEPEVGARSKLLQNVPENTKNHYNIETILKDMPLTKDVTCGFWFLKGSFFQKFANETAFLCVYGAVGCIISMSYAYFNGTITTMEKRFKIPSRNSGMIAVGHDVTLVIASVILSYYGSKSHRPHWIAVGILTSVVYCTLSVIPHFMYGPGEDALALTKEFGYLYEKNLSLPDLDELQSKELCKYRVGGGKCEEEGASNLAPQLILFLGQVISGIGGSLYHTLGISYMDDNTKKAKTPVLLSYSYFLLMTGPAIGYAIASFCLRIYIAPSLEPTIEPKDPRWLGAWWLGWIIFACSVSLFCIPMMLFPKELPQTAARRKLRELEANGQPAPDNPKPSFKDMLSIFKELLANKIFMCNNLSSVLYVFGYVPFWMFIAKYIEVQYRLSAANSSMTTGTVALVFSAIGVLVAGLVISKYKPSARYMATWNVIVGALTVLGMITYAFIGCPDNENSMIVNIHDSSLNNSVTCNSDCNCDYVRYSPVCGEDSMTYISPCHAGCRKQHIGDDGRKVFFDCACIKSGNSSIFGKLSNQEMAASDMTLGWKDTNLDQTTPSALPLTTLTNYPEDVLGGQAIPGSCPINCFTQFVTFLAVMCCLKFVGASGRASNFLVSVRCVPEKDKTVSMGFGMMMMSMMAFIPSPIFFGWVIDNLCLVWGKTCTNKGNCWLYDPKSLRYTLNSLGSTFVLVGTLFDVGVWYFVKDLQIFDEEVKDMEMDIVQHEEEVNQEKAMEA